MRTTWARHRHRSHEFQVQAAVRDPTWVTESIGGIGEDGRPLVTRTSFRLLQTLRRRAPRAPSGTWRSTVGHAGDGSRSPRPAAGRPAQRSRPSGTSVSDGAGPRTRSRSDHEVKDQASPSPASLSPWPAPAGCARAWASTWPLLTPLP
ncbi:pyruvate formate lyase family protein [Streptomyces sp. NPDC057430]|uniref:pyruvate formate lyase family protein n=1 Tax=Streptomyces sp. NPDC057430 TaxID=3346131 RepID=UPI0036C0C3CD